LARWRSAILQPRETGVTVQSWLWAAPAKHSSRQIEEVLERIELLTELGVDRHLRELSDAIVHRYARRLAARAPALELIQTHRAQRPRSRAEIVRERLIEGARPVRALLKVLVGLPWQAAQAHPVLQAVAVLRDLYERDERALPESGIPSLGRVWRTALSGKDREHAFAATEVATLLNLRRGIP
jgi:hypothetical protein